MIVVEFLCRVTVVVPRTPPVLLLLRLFSSPDGDSCSGDDGHIDLTYDRRLSLQVVQESQPPWVLTGNPHSIWRSRRDAGVLFFQQVRQFDSLLKSLKKRKGCRHRAKCANYKRGEVENIPTRLLLIAQNGSVYMSALYARE